MHVFSNEQCGHANDYISSIAFAWNLTFSESLGASPFEVSLFEVYTGMKAKTVADGFLCTGPATGKVDVALIKAAAAEFTRVARATADYQRELIVEVMNKHGRVLRALNVGEHVKIYAPQAIKKPR